MPGHGPPPKDPAQRRRYNQPGRSEWVDLEPLTRPILCRYQPSRFTVYPWVWNGWRADPVTSQYGEADIAAIELLATDWINLSYADQDRRMTVLGLNPKGRRDLRWRTALEADQQKKATEKTAVVRRLRLIEERKTDKETA